MSDEPTTPKLQVQIDEDIAQGVYSNLVLLNHTENEFVLDFAFIQPSNGRAKVRSRVISSPRHTKRLLQALHKNLERYEERFGTIDISSDDDPVFHYAVRRRRARGSRSRRDRDRARMARRTEPPRCDGRDRWVRPPRRECRRRADTRGWQRARHPRDRAPRSADSDRCIA